MDAQNERRCIRFWYEHPYGFSNGEGQSAVHRLGILLGMLLAFLLGRVLDVSTNASVLVGVGTAICGGSAIAAVAPIIDAKDDETAVSLSTVF
jgi:uncharacterized membrane protein YadS